MLLNRGLRRGTTLSLLLVMLLLASLSVTSLVAAQAPESGSIGAKGGTLSYAEGDVTVTLPDGAISTDIDLTYTPWASGAIPGAAPSGTLFGSKAFALDVSVGGEAQTSYTLSRFAQVIIKYSADDIAAADNGRESNIALYVYDAALERWNKDASAIQDVVNQTYTSSQTGLGTSGAGGFALVVTSAAGSAAAATTTTVAPAATAEAPETGGIGVSSQTLGLFVLAEFTLVCVGTYVSRRKVSTQQV